MRKPKVGDRVRITGTLESDTHIATVNALHSSQFTALYEVARADGGWTERQLWAFYSDHGAGWDFEK